MNRIEIIDPEKDPRWDRFVENHPYGQVYHLSAWKKVLEKSFPHMQGNYYTLVDPSGKNLQAALPIYFIKSPIMGKRLVSVPYATLFDPLIGSSGDFDILFHRICEERVKLRTKFIEIRAFKSNGFLKSSALGVSRMHKYHFLEIQNDLDRIKKTFQKRSVGYINRALKSGMAVSFVQGINGIKEFYRFYVLTRKRLLLPPQPYRFLENIWLNFHPSGLFEIMLVSYKGRNIGGLALFKFKEKVAIEFVGWDDEYRSLRPTHYLFWNAIKNAHHAGYKVFDFGRTSKDNLGLMQFKNHWGTTIKDIPTYYYPAHLAECSTHQRNSMQMKLITMLSRNLRMKSFIALGEFCYSHMG